MLTVVAADNASAWKHNVKKAERRLLFIRPNLMLVEDLVNLEEPETGIQSWNSLGAWTILTTNSCRTSVGPVTADLRCLIPRNVSLTASEDSVHRSPTTAEIVPAYRAAFETADSTHHHLFTLITIGSELNQQAGLQAERIQTDPLVLRIQNDQDTILITPQGTLAGAALPGVQTDGSLTALVLRNSTPTAAITVDATTLTINGHTTEGAGFIMWRSQND